MLEPIDWVADCAFLLDQVHAIDSRPWLTGVPAQEMRNILLSEGQALIETVVAPTRREGDRHPARLVDGAVVTPPGFKEAYRRLVEGGWNAPTIPEAEGGMGLSPVIGHFIAELKAGANPALQMYYGFADAAVRTLRRFGEPWLADLVNPRLVAGEWTATMCLTEPSAGTDLTQISTKAVRQPDGAYRVFGSKIFISGGDHDLAGNIVHMVLARIEDEPGASTPGLRGLGVIVTPKFDFHTGASNQVEVRSLEHKMGLNGNATCAMDFEGAKGWRLAPGPGGRSSGMAALFDMMNQARLDTGVGALGAASVAAAKAHAYACERRSGKALGSQNPGAAADPIIEHPDVARMVLSGWSLVEGGRALLSWAAVLIEESQHHPDPEARREAELLSHLLTPVLKAFLSDQAHAACDDCIQVHGGHGYVQETGVEQLVRDIRVTRIYEGANGIQAQDLVMRRMTAAGGAGVELLVGQVEVFVAAHAAEPALAAIIEPLQLAVGHWKAVLDLVAACRQDNPRVLLECSTYVLQVFGLVLVAWRSAVSASVAAKGAPELYGHKRRLAEHWCAHHLARIVGLRASLEWALGQWARSG